MTRKLDRLNQTNSQGLAFQRLWQKNCETVEGNFDDLGAQLAAINRALSQMPELPPVTITANYLGTVDPSTQLPMNIQATRLQDSTDVTASSAWSISASTGAVTATIGAATGLVTITAAVGPDDLTVTSVNSGVTRSTLLSVGFSIAAPPNTGTTGGGTTATDTSFSTFNSATMAAVSDELTAVVGSAGRVQLSAPLTVSTSAGGTNGLFPVFGIWRHWNGSAYVDVGTEVQSSPSCEVSPTSVSNGSLSVASLVTGLTTGASEKFRLYARNGSGTRVMSLSGTASAVAPT